MNEHCVRIEFKWPWKMLPLECADEWIEFIRAQIGPGHPLFEKTIFPSARREDEETILVDNEDDDIYVILSFGRKLSPSKTSQSVTLVMTHGMIATISRTCRVKKMGTYPHYQLL